MSKPSSVYIAGRFEHRPRLRLVRAALQAKGVEVTSRWLDVPDSVPSLPPDDAELCRREAYRDIEDIHRAEAFILDEAGEGGVGRYVELGIAIAKNKRIYIVGEKTSVFSFIEAEVYEIGWEALWNSWFEDMTGYDCAFDLRAQVNRDIEAGARKFTEAAEAYDAEVETKRVEEARLAGATVNVGKRYAEDIVAPVMFAENERLRRLSLTHEHAWSEEQGKPSHEAARMAYYGPPEARLKMLGMLYAAMLGLPEPIPGEKVALMAAADKLTRLGRSFRLDSYEDLLEYVGFAKRMALTGVSSDAE